MLENVVSDVWVTWERISQNTCSTLQVVVRCIDYKTGWLILYKLSHWISRLSVVRICIRSGDYRTLDAGIDDGKWFAAKAIKANNDLKRNYKLIPVPLTPTVGWHAFLSQNIPSLFNYGYTYYYTLESIQHFSCQDKDNGLGYMTDKPMKNGKKYVDSGFLHDMMDNANDEHYFVRAHVWPSTKTDLPHNVVVVLSVISGAVIHASCEPCRASSLGRCSHVVAVLFSILDHIKKHGPTLLKPCTSQECSWNKGKKRDKNPRRVSDAKYQKTFINILMLLVLSPILTCCI